MIHILNDAHKKTNDDLEFCKLLLFKNPELLNLKMCRRKNSFRMGLKNIIHNTKLI
jgi:hypothetical protein